MYRRSLIEIAGYYPTDTVFMEDNVLWGKALKAGFKFANIPEYRFKFRIDKDFFKRRSGFKYGWNYIQTKLKANKALKTPFYTYLVSIGKGLLKMLPAVLLRSVYLLHRKYS